MAQPPLKPLSTLYKTDLALWFAQTIHALKTRDVDQVDWEHLLAGRDKRELKIRLTTLFEHLLKHLLKRTCVNLPECSWLGWHDQVFPNRNSRDVATIAQFAILFPRYSFELLCRRSGHCPG